MAKWLAKTPVTPNQASLVSFTTALASLGFFLAGHNLWAGLAAQVSSILDGVDGDLARFKGMVTPFGGFFDAVLDRYADAAILAGMTFWALHYEARGPQWATIVLGLLAIVGALLVSYTRARSEASLGDTFSGPAGFLASRDVRLLLVMIGALLGQALATLTLLALLTNGVVLWRVLLARELLSSERAIVFSFSSLGKSPENKKEETDERKQVRFLH